MCALFLLSLIRPVIVVTAERSFSSKVFWKLWGAQWYRGAEWTGYIGKKLNLEQIAAHWLFLINSRTLRSITCVWAMHCLCTSLSRFSFFALVCVFVGCSNCGVYTVSTSLCCLGDALLCCWSGRLFNLCNLILLVAPRNCFVFLSFSYNYYYILFFGE